METINNKDLAKAIDFINEWCVNYYNRTIDTPPDPYKIQEALTVKYGLDYKYFEYAYRIMHLEGLIEYISKNDEDNLIRTFKHTDKGLLLFLNGGMHEKVLSKLNAEKIVQEQIQSTVRTNSFVRKTTRFQIAILFVTIIVTAIGSIATWGQYQLQKQNSNKRDTIIIENRLIESQANPKQNDTVQHKQQRR